MSKLPTMFTEHYKVIIVRNGVKVAFPCTVQSGGGRAGRKRADAFGATIAAEQGGEFVGSEHNGGPSRITEETVVG